MPATTCSPTISSDNGACQPPNANPPSGSSRRLRYGVQRREQIDVDHSHGEILLRRVSLLPTLDRCRAEGPGEAAMNGPFAKVHRTTGSGRRNDTCPGERSTIAPSPPPA